MGGLTALAIHQKQRQKSRYATSKSLPSGASPRCPIDSDAAVGTVS